MLWHNKFLASVDHIDILINNAGRSIRRAVHESTDRFHDFERTMQLNYFGAVRYGDEFTAENDDSP